MMRLFVFLAAASSLLAASPGLMPWPAKISMGQGSLAIGRPLRIALTGYQEPRLRQASDRLAARLMIEAEFVEDPSAAVLVIQCDHASAPVQKLGEDESYKLEVSRRQARLAASNPLGILRGLETFLQ